MSDKFLKTVDNKTESLVFGYIRCNFVHVIDQIVPSSIILLCLKFYHSKLIIILINDKVYKSVDPRMPNIIVSDLDANKHHHCVIKPLLPPTRTYSSRTVVNAAICYVKNFKLPQAITSKFSELTSNGCYDIIFKLGTSEYAVSYIIDINNKPNIYHYELPSLLRGISGSCALYSNKYGLIEIGGHPDQYSSNNYKNQKKFNLLKFDDNININEWKWEQIDILQRPRRYGSAIFHPGVDSDKVIFCGGYNSTPRKYYSFVDIYDFNLKKWIQLSNMKYERCRAGIYIDRYMNHKLYVCCGRVGRSDEKKNVELLDMNLNEWSELCNTNEAHGANPIIWSENVNMLHIASTYTGVFEKMDLRENKWRIYKHIIDDQLFGDAKISKRSGNCRLLF